MGCGSNPGKPVTRNTLGKQVETKGGAFMSSELPIAGFAIIDAESISEAIQNVAHTPCAIAYGVVEVWPLEGRHCERNTTTWEETNQFRKPVSEIQ